ncbi:putative protein disulfide isomerase [Trypanosoma vivax]|nr:putative protein disulfide isomerase [Trypanosoma vivax]
MFVSRTICKTLFVVLLASAALTTVRASAEDAASGTSSSVVELVPDTFEKTVKDPTKHVFVMFYAPWCGHCNRLKPKWEELARELKGDESLVIAKVDADAHHDIANQYDVQGYPTLRLYTKGNKGGVLYEGKRDVAALREFLNTHTKQ